jgi:hypothetical protein
MRINKLKIMKCIRKIAVENGVKYISDECTPEEEAECIEFRKKYKVKYISETTGIYGGSEEITLRYYESNYTDDQLVCIFSDGELIGCYCKDKEYYINGKKSYSRISDSGPQGPLIWDRDTWELLKRD